MPPLLYAMNSWRRRPREWWGAQHLHRARLLAGRHDAREVDLRRWRDTSGGRIARRAQERLDPGARGAHSQEPGALRRDEERMRRSSRGERDAAGADEVLRSVDVHQELTLEDVEGLVGVRMHVQRGGLAPLRDVFEQEERAARLQRRHLDRDEPAAEPQQLPFAVCYDHWKCHRSSLARWSHRS